MTVSYLFPILIYIQKRIPRPIYLYTHIVSLLSCGSLHVVTYGKLAWLFHFFMSNRLYQQILSVVFSTCITSSWLFFLFRAENYFDFRFADRIAATSETPLLHVVPGEKLVANVTTLVYNFVDTSSISRQKLRRRVSYCRETPFQPSYRQLSYGAPGRRCSNWDDAIAWLAAAIVFFQQ